MQPRVEGSGREVLRHLLDVAKQSSNVPLLVGRSSALSIPCQVAGLSVRPIKGCLEARCHLRGPVAGGRKKILGPHILLFWAEIEELDQCTQVNHERFE